MGDDNANIIMEEDIENMGEEEEEEEVDDDDVKDIRIISPGGSAHKKKSSWKPEYSKNRKFKDKYRQLFPWVRSSPFCPQEAFCTICECTLHPKVSTLRSHENTVKHKKRAEGGYIPKGPPKPKRREIEKMIKKEHGLPSEYVFGETETLSVPFTLNDKSIVYVKGLSNPDNTISDTSKEKVAPAKIGFIGCGNIAQAIIKGLLGHGLVEAHSLWASAPSDKNLVKLPHGMHATNNNNIIIEECDIIFICVKSEVLPEMVMSLEALERDHNPLFISFVKDFTISTIEAMFSTLTEGPRIVRAVPNSICLIGEGCCVYVMGSNTNDGDVEVVQSMLNSISFCARVEEHEIGAFCGLACSGPAFIYIAIKALSDGGVKMGLRRKVSQSIAINMIKGAVAMVQKSGKHPTQLEEELASDPGGTIEGMHVLEKHGFRNSLISAVETTVISNSQETHIDTFEKSNQ